MQSRRCYRTEKGVFAFWEYQPTFQAEEEKNSQVRTKDVRHSRILDLAPFCLNACNSQCSTYGQIHCRFPDRVFLAVLAVSWHYLIPGQI